MVILVSELVQRPHWACRQYGHSGGTRGWLGVESKVINPSEATHSATQFFKRAYKIGHPLRLYAFRVALPSFAVSSKIRPAFNKKVFLKLKLTKNHFSKKCAPKFLFFNEKKIRKIRMIFNVENSL